MHNKNDNLVKMANQIGTFFESQSSGDPALAAQAVAGHLKLFWAPTMRVDLIATFDRGETAPMMPVVKAAIVAHRLTLLDTRAHVPAESDEVFPEGGGDAG